MQSNQLKQEGFDLLGCRPPERIQTADDAIESAEQFCGHSHTDFVSVMTEDGRQEVWGKPKSKPSSPLV